MKLLVAGAGGRTGRLVVEQATVAGHDVTALVRDAAKLDASVAARVVEIDLADASAVSSAVAGHDAVIVTLGPPKKTDPDLLTEGVRNIASAMQAHGVRRIVAIGGGAVLDPTDHPNRRVRFLVGILKRMIGADVDAKRAQWHLLRDSGLDWTVVRPPMLRDGPLTKQYRAGENLQLVPGTKISRNNLAHFLLRCVESNDFAGQASFVTE